MSTLTTPRTGSVYLLGSQARATMNPITASSPRFAEIDAEDVWRAPQPCAHPLEVGAQPVALPGARVMLLGLDWPQTGYLVAALHAAGIQTTLLSTGRPDRLGLGRYCEQVQTPNERSPDYEPFLREQVGLRRPDLLIPLCEPLMELLWSLDPPPAPVYPRIEPWQREIVTDRTRLYECAREAGVPIAPWMPLEGPQSLGDAARRFGFPLVLRGTSGCAGMQVRIVHSLEEARAAADALREISPGSPFAQAFVAGHRQLCGGVFQRGEMLRSFTQMTLECHPPGTGPSIRVRAVRDEAMEACTAALMRRLRWSGMACAEFMREGAGRLVLLEINVRPWAALEVAERCGVGLSRAFAEVLTGQAPTGAAAHRTGFESLVLEGFLRARRAGSIWRTYPRLPWRDAWACLRAIPWRQPWLALHVLRRAYRAFDGVRSSV